MRKSRRTNAIHEVNAGFAATGPELAAGAGSSSSPPLCCPAKRSAAHVEDNNERQVDGGNDEVTDIPAIGAMAHRTSCLCRLFQRLRQRTANTRYKRNKRVRYTEY